MATFQQRIILILVCRTPDVANPQDWLEKRIFSSTDTNGNFGVGYINGGKWGVGTRSSAMFAKIFYRKNPAGFVEKNSVNHEYEQQR